MKTMMLAAVAALSLASTAAYADGGQGTIPNTYFTQLPGVVAQAPVQNAPMMARSGQGVQVFAAQSNHGTWLFPPDANGGGNS